MSVLEYMIEAGHLGDSNIRVVSQCLSQGGKIQVRWHHEIFRPVQSENRNTDLTQRPPGIVGKNESHIRQLSEMEGLVGLGLRRLRFRIGQRACLKSNAALTPR